MTGKERECRRFQERVRESATKETEPSVKSEKPKEETHQIDEAVDKGFNAELERSPAVHLFVPLGPLRGIRLMDQVAHSIFGLGCSR